MSTGEASTRTVRVLSGLAAFMAVMAGATAACAQEVLFESRRLTPKNEYTGGIEGPAVDAAGTLFVVGFRVDNLTDRGAIGKVAAGATRSELFAKLPKHSFGNGIRFDRDGRMYVADFNRHNVLVFERGQTEAVLYFHSDQFNQPNDLAIADDGTLYASDPHFKKPVGGQIWRITRRPDGQGHGEVMTSDRPQMGTTNGIDLSPDGQTLYVSESNTHQVWAYRLDGTRLTASRPVMTFDAAADLDGLRTDRDGKIFVARNGNGIVAVLTPDGQQVHEVRTVGKNPSNLTFGGPDGRTVFVTQVDGRFIESFRTDRPGREPCLQFSGALC